MLLVTSGLEEKLTGTLVYCVKADANKELKMRNIADVSTLLELVNKFFFLFQCIVYPIKQGFDLINK